jgi:hypothetical protein
MEIIISSSQSLHPHQDVTIEKEEHIGLDLDAVTEATESEITEGDLLSQTSSTNSAEDEHEDFSSLSFHEAYSQISPRAPQELVSSRKSSILKRSVSAEDVQFIKTSKRCWHCLPRPDLDEMVRSKSAEDVQIDAYISSSRSQSVRFGRVVIRRYTQTLGDNPSCSYGPPVQLDWEYEEHDPLSLDEYEDKRPPRKTMRQMVLSYYVRKNILQFFYGISDEDLKASKRQINREKLCRSVTASSVLLMPVEAALESAARKTRRFFGKKSET